MTDNHTIADLRNELFETIKQLKEGEIEIDKAKAISDLGQRVINSAKVELDFMKMTESKRSDFMMDESKRQRLEIEAKKRLPENQKYFKTNN